MEEKEFNLLEEPWIRVMLPNCAIQEVSLTDALLQAHHFVSLAGELPTQDMALLRLLLAVLHTVFSRVNETGQDDPIKNMGKAFDHWEALWKMKRFPETPIREYLETWKERFYLFHPTRPFYQVNEAEKGTEFTAAKLNGEISESSNKVRLFPVRAGAQKNRLTYAEAARWLIYLNGFDDTSAKPKGKNLPSPGAGWLGKLGLIAAQGENLFETLMLNLVLLDENNSVWEKNIPIWEMDEPPTEERCEIIIPDNQAELLTLQSRRLLLIRREQAVTGYKLLGGDFFDKKDAYAEQMTQWTRIPGKGSQASYDQPRRHDPSKQIWREFPTIVNTNTEMQDEKKPPMPGVVHWQELLRYNHCLEANRMARFQVAGVQFGDKDFFVTDAYSDTLSFHLDLLTQAGKAWNDRIETEIARADQVAAAAMLLGMNLEKAAGGDGKVLGDWMKEQFYAHIDLPFRAFLTSVSAEDDAKTVQKRLSAWHKQERNIALALGNEAVRQSSQEAFVGRTIKEKVKNKDVERHYSTPEAYNWYLAKINRIVKAEEGATEK